MIKRLALLILLFLPFTFAQMQDTLEEGEVQTYTLNGFEYNVIFIILDDNELTARFNINGQLTPQMHEDQTVDLANGARFEILELLSNEGGDVTQDLAEFRIWYCGDNTCSTEEGCSVCAADCGCTTNEFCEGNRCNPIRCGDDVCSADENCEEDNCCDGTETDMDTIENCGGCNIECENYEKCSKRACVTYCGNTVCEPEEQQSCRKDCGYCSDKICQSYEKKTCADCAPKPLPVPTPPLPKDQCTSSDDCTDNNPCTKDRCDGLPKKCAYGKQEGCIDGTNCISRNNVAMVNGLASYCDENKWITRKVESSPCTTNNECLSNACKNDTCYVQRKFIEHVFNWFRKILK